MHQEENVRLRSELQKHAEAQHQLVAKERVLVDLQEQSEQQTKAFAEQRAEVQRLKAQLADFEGTRQQLADASRQLASVSEQREMLSQQRAEMQTEIKKLGTRAALQSNNVQDLQRQLATKSKAFDNVVREHNDAVAKLQSQSGTLQKLQSQIAAAEKLRPANKSLQEKVNDLTAHLKRLSAELDDSLQANAKIGDRIRQLENQAHDDANTIRKLRRQRGSIDGMEGDRKAA